MVRLITHNMLTCHVKNCNQNNFPLPFSSVSLELRPTPPNLPFILRFLPKLNYKALRDTARSLGDDSLPEEGEVPSLEGVEGELEAMEDEGEGDDEDMGGEGEGESEGVKFLRKLHHVLMEIHVEEGIMTCPNCDHKYPISSGIPNMMLAEHEVGR